MDHEEGNLFTQDFGITLKDLDKQFELTSYFLSATGPTHLDKLLFYSLKLHSTEGKYLFFITHFFFVCGCLNRSSKCFKLRLADKPQKDNLGAAKVTMERSR